MCVYDSGRRGESVESRSQDVAIVNGGGRRPGGSRAERGGNAARTDEHDSLTDGLENLSASLQTRTDEKAA